MYETYPYENPNDVPATCDSCGCEECECSTSRDEVDAGLRLTQWEEELLQDSSPDYANVACSERDLGDPPLMDPVPWPLFEDVPYVEFAADDELPPPDEGPAYRDFPGEERAYGPEALDEMERESLYADWNARR